MKKEQVIKTSKENTKGMILGGGFFAILGTILTNFTPIFYLFVAVGIFLMFFGLFNEIELQDYIKHPDKYKNRICQRCGVIRKQEKPFCDDCKNKIKKVMKHKEDEKNINNYIKLLNKEKK